MLREAKKIRNELRALLEDARINTWTRRSTEA
jgi:hypothetical protein